jgi:ubiquinone/menaquinone biosynthesis C-methylase UbiE
LLANKERNHPAVNFLQENIERLSFADNEFDTVISSHTLEHVQDAQAAIQELRRVTKSRLIVVLPKQRPYRYTFDLHLRFFPYSHTVVEYMRPPFHRVKTISGKSKTAGIIRRQDFLIFRREDNISPDTRSN